MTEEKIFAKETFIELLGKNGVERIEFEDKLLIEARRLGLEKKFKESLKKYEKLAKEKISLKSEPELPKCKYDIKKYNMGKYS